MNKQSFLKLLYKRITSVDYYVSLFFTLLYISFIMILWLYLNKNGEIDVTNLQVVLYFLGVAVFQYLFTYSFADDVSDVLGNNLDNVLLNPISIFAYLFKKRFLVYIRDAMLPGIVLLLGLYFLDILTLEQIMLIGVFFILGNCYYFFLSITMAIIGLMINWSEWIGFSLRFIGFVWNGSYIPLVFMTGTLSTVTKILPFMPSGLFLQFIWYEIDYLKYLPFVLIGLGFWILMSLVTIKFYVKNKRI